MPRSEGTDEMTETTTCDNQGEAFQEASEGDAVKRPGEV